MKNLILFSLAFASASAFARPNTQSLNCAAAAALVQSNGAIVLSTGDGLYDRFVADGSYCAIGEVTAPAFVPTLDSDECFVGYVCASRKDGGARVYPRGVLSCQEGQIQNIIEGRDGGDKTLSVPYICRSGKWEREFGGSTGGSVTEPLSCSEGTEQVIYETVGGNDRTSAVLYLCRAGKWVKEF